MYGIPEHSLQTILMDRFKYTKKNATDWLKHHGYEYRDHRIEGLHRRFRQIPPIEGAHYYSKKITPDIVLVFQEY
jgi:hypothetical protein